MTNFIKASCFITILLGTQTIQPNFWQDIGFESKDTVQAVKVATPVFSIPLTDIPTLTAIFTNDDLAGLTQFLSTHPSIDWTTAYAKFPRGNRQSTPLIAATWCGAAKCITYLFSQKPSNFMSSINTPNLKGHTALYYAKNPPKIHFHLSQNPTNFANITSLLLSNGAK